MFLTRLTSKYAYRHNDVYFFDIGLQSDRQKAVRRPGALYIFTSKRASRHNGVHFFDISTSKSRPRPTCFATFPFQMCFMPQWRALFPHLKCQKPSETEVFCTLPLPNVLRATTAHTFSTSQLPKVLRDRRVLPLFTYKCASRHAKAKNIQKITTTTTTTKLTPLDYCSCIQASSS